MVLRAQFQMWILALHLAVHISFKPNFNRVKVLVPDFILWSDGLVVKSLDSQSRGPVFKTTGWLQGRLSLSFFRG